MAHLDAGGTPVLTPFVNDTTPTAAGQARITARHTAAAPEVDVRANGDVVFAGLTNPDEDSAEVIDSPQALIGQQVAAGVVVRMAVLYELLGGADEMPLTRVREAV